MGAREGYFEDWYKQNRLSILARRRERYANDPDYAARCREASSKYREGLKGRRQSNPPAKRPRKPTALVLNGVPTQGWSVGHLAAKIGRSIPTVNHWAKQGLLPETPLRGNGDARLYTEEMMRVVSSAVLRRGEVKKTDRSFYEEIEEGWRELGIELDELDVA